MDESSCSAPAGFLSMLDSKDRADILSIATTHRCAKDTMVFHAGRSSNDVFIVLHGRVKVFEASCGGKEVILWFCFAGDLFGVAEVMRPERRQVNAQACSPVEYLSIRQKDFIGYLTQHPTAAMRVITLLSQHLRELSDVLLNITSDDVTDRVAKLIVRLAARYGRTCGDSVCLDLPVTHQEMADMIGASRQTVTTVLGGLKRRGVLRTERRTIYVQDQGWVNDINRYAQRFYDSNIVAQQCYPPPLAISAPVIAAVRGAG